MTQWTDAVMAGIIRAARVYARRGRVRTSSSQAYFNGVAAKLLHSSKLEKVGGACTVLGHMDTMLILDIQR